MHKASRFLLPVIVALLPAGCAAQSTEERVSRLEGQANSLRILDMRVNHVEERLAEVETAIGEMRQSKDSGGRGAKLPARGRRDGGQAAASPRETAVIITPPSVEPPSSLTLAKAREIDPMRGPAGLQSDYFSGPSPRSVPPRASEESVPPPALSRDLSGPELVPQGMGASGGGRPVSKTPSPASSLASKGSDVTPTGKRGYDAALALYYKGDYAKAQEAFSAFLRSSPDSSLAPNALYWQGECLYSLGKYDGAIMIFKDVAAKYPRHNKAAASLLKAGYSYERLNDKENAHFYWQMLLDDFPDSAPAAMARKRMAG